METYIYHTDNILVNPAIQLNVSTESWRELVAVVSPFMAVERPACGLRNKALLVKKLHDFCGKRSFPWAMVRKC